MVHGLCVAAVILSASLLVIISSDFATGFVTADEQKTRSDDLTSMLSFFQSSPRDSPVKARSTNKPPSSDSTSSGGKSKKKKSKGKCKCQRQASRRLRREIKDIAFKSCDSQETILSDSEMVLNFGNLTVSPKPLIAPGDMLVNFYVDVLQKLPANMQVDVDVYKYMFDTLPVKVPCILVAHSDGIRLGSCTYTDIMTTIRGDTLCPSFSQNGFPCDREKITPGRYKFNSPIPVIIPNMNSIFDVLVKGVYKLQATFVDTRTKLEVGCFEANWTISKVHRKSENRQTSYRAKRWADQNLPNNLTVFSSMV